MLREGNQNKSKGWYNYWNLLSSISKFQTIDTLYLVQSPY